MTVATTVIATAIMLGGLLSGGASRAWPHHCRHERSQHEAERALAVPGPEIYEWRKFQSDDPFFAG